MKILLISGKQGSGKTTLAEGLTKVCHALMYEPIRTRFSEILYKIHDSARDTARSYGIDYPTKFGPLLQELGTSLGRDTFGEDIWVDALKRKVEKDSIHNGVVIIDDARFLNEIECFDGSEHQVFKIRLDASKDNRQERADAWRDNDTHASEVSLDDYKGFNLNIQTDTTGQAKTLKVVSDFVFYECWHDNYISVEDFIRMSKP
jgi:hypothetical protein